MKPKKTVLRLAEVGESTEKSGKAQPTGKRGESCALEAQGREASRRTHCVNAAKGSVGRGLKSIQRISDKDPVLWMTVGSVVRWGRREIAVSEE